MLLSIAALGVALTVFCLMMLASALTEEAPPESRSSRSWAGHDGLRRLFRLVVPVLGVLGGLALLRDVATNGEITKALTTDPSPQSATESRGRQA